MNCYLCDAVERERGAVAICQYCGIALCREHLHEDLVVPGRAGLAGRTCTHSPVHDAHRRTVPRVRQPVAH